MSRAVIQGSMQEYISNIDFSLNFEDTKKSVKVHIGDIVWYDGLIARYKKNSGEEISGKTPSLGSAIASNWLTLNIAGAEPGSVSVKADKVREGVSMTSMDNKMSDAVKEQTPKYDRVRGGDFDKFLANDPTIVVGKNKTQVIREEDRVIRKLDTVSDQVKIKDVEGTSVSSSTAVPPAQKKFNTTIINADQYNADSSIPLKTKVASQGTAQKKANVFTVDDSTSRLPEDATMKEVNRATNRPVVEAVESQDAVIVRKVQRPKLQVECLEGVTLRNEVGSSDKEIDFSVKTSSGNAPIDFSVKTSPGSTPVTDLSSLDDNIKDLTNEIAPGTGKVALMSEKKKEANAQYLKMLPEDWAKMHWVKKEQFIKSQTDKEFIKFILTVEPVKAVQNACRKRLVELEKLAMQK
jgi:hypothetical protein